MRKIKRLHRYNAREEQMRVEMMLRRSWARYRRHVRHVPGWFWKARYAILPWVIPDPDKVDNPEPGVYVHEWNFPLDKPAGGA